MFSTSREMPSNPHHGLVQLTILLLLAGDVERNPGPQPTAKTQTSIFQCALFATLLNNLLVASARPGLPLSYTPLALPGIYSPPVLLWLSVLVALLGAFVGGCSVESAWLPPARSVYSWGLCLTRQTSVAVLRRSSHCKSKILTSPVVSPEIYRIVMV